MYSIITPCWITGYALYQFSLFMCFPPAVYYTKLINNDGAADGLGEMGQLSSSTLQSFAHRMGVPGFGVFVHVDRRLLLVSLSHYDTGLITVLDHHSTLISYRTLI